MVKFKDFARPLSDFPVLFKTELIVWLFLAVPWVCMQFVIVVFPDHTHLLFFKDISRKPSISRYFNKLKGCANLCTGLTFFN